MGHLVALERGQQQGDVVCRLLQQRQAPQHDVVPWLAAPRRPVAHARRQVLPGKSVAALAPRALGPAVTRLAVAAHQLLALATDRSH